MNHQHKLSAQQQAELLALEALHQTQGPAPKEFAGPEQLLRHDALHTPVPPSIAQRLQGSLNQAPPPAPAWWRRLFGPAKP